jgi:hypothetical protein
MPIDMLERDERASQAKALLEDPLLQTVLQGLLDEATEQLLANPPGSAASYTAHHRVLAVRALQADLIRLVDDPKILRAAAERRRRFAS